MGNTRHKTRFHAAIRLCVLWLAALAGPAIPGLGDEPVSPGVKREFERLFGNRIKRLGSDGSPNERGKLAEQIFLEARSRSDNPAFVTYALDQVVQLAAPCPGHQRLAYAALQTQKRSRLKRPKPTLHKMMALAPQVLGAMDVDSRAHWLKTVWLHDALELAFLYCREGAYAKAQSVLEQVRQKAQPLRIPLPKDVAQNAEGLKLLSNLRRQSPNLDGAGSKVLVYRAVLAVVQDEDLSGAAGHLRRTGKSGARELAKALEAAAKGANTEGARARLGSSVTSLGLPSLIERLFRQKLERVGRGPLGRIVKQTFFGIPFHGTRRIVFIVDFSGSMTDRLYYAKNELKRAVDSLTPDQSFQVLFFDTEAVEMPGSGMLTATEANKTQARSFIDSMSSGGGTNPSGALRRAFALRADTVNLLTDGEFEPTVGALVDRLNTRKTTRVNTICFFSNSGEAVLRGIAKRNLGTYKFVGN